MTPRTPMTGEEVADVLERAADLIEPEGAWIQGAYGQDDDGEPTVSIYALSSSSECHCVLGALAHVVGEDRMYEFADALVPVIGVRDYLGVAPWNDASERTQAEVVAALRSAATAARQQGEGK
ncbi:hypothetical protein [Sphingomonas sp. NIC1]|uniref:DUF6197 family protein n=1 Tax=Sphingomonas sp. NIC1 TaxID=1961362 RepID=UPI0007C0EE38|nr:hypothetical protein [Sphingomonas sp. NIC1]ANC85440.1 hypothetical protein A7E77_00130 [Sphingomonas sp. NIC1]